MIKTGSLADPAAVSLDDEVTYNFVVTHTGTTTLTGVGITDDLDGLSAITFGAWPTADGVLAPGESVEATATYAVSQADIDARKVDNTATATGTDPDGETVSGIGSTTVNLSAAPAVELVKSAELADDNEDGAANPGETITYSFEVTNTGNVTLVDLVVDDPMVTGIGTIDRLAPGDAVTVTADGYTVTDDDAAAGEVINTATVTGDSARGTTTSPESTATLEAAALSDEEEPTDPEEPKAPTTPEEPKAPTTPEGPKAPVDPEAPGGGGPPQGANPPTGLDPVAAPTGPGTPGTPAQPGSPLAPSQAGTPTGATGATAPAVAGIAQPAAASLPRTGSDNARIALMATVLILFGAALVLTARRRRASTRT